MGQRRAEHGSHGRRGVQQVLHGALVVALALPPAGARAGAAAADGGANRDVQSLYEACLQQLDGGQAVQAASCLQDVYAGLVNIEKSPRTDLYYVLADAVAASQAAAASEPRTLCLAQKLILDFQSRERVATFYRYRRKVAKMATAVAAALAEAGLTEVQCAADTSPTSTTPGEAVGTPGEGVTPSGDGTTTPGEGVTPTDGTTPPGDEGEPADATTPTDAVKPSPAVKPATRPVPRPQVGPGTAPRSTRKLQLTAKTDLMDAGFATTIVSVSVVGLGGALWAAKVECDARVGSESPCPSPVPQGVRDAGLALMSIGVAGAFVGLALRWTDQRRQRKLRQAPLPGATPTSVGVVWRGQF